MGLYEGAKGVANILKEAGKIEEYLKIIDLIDDLLEKQRKIQILEEENTRLKNKLMISESYYFKNNAYYHENTEDGPFCSRCFDKDKNLIRIIPRKLSSNNSFCPECKNMVNLTGREDAIHTYIPRASNSSPL